MRSGEGGIERELGINQKNAPTAFADYVAGRINDKPIPYSLRHRLLRDAQRHGIDRFEANLIIATVHHRLIGHGEHASGSARSRWPRWTWSLLTALVLQLTLATVVWIVLW